MTSVTPAAGPSSPTHGPWRRFALALDLRPHGRCPGDLAIRDHPETHQRDEPRRRRGSPTDPSTRRPARDAMSDETLYSKVRVVQRWAWGPRSTIRSNVRGIPATRALGFRSPDPPPWRPSARSRPGLDCSGHSTTVRSLPQCSILRFSRPSPSRSGPRRSRFCPFEASVYHRECNVNGSCRRPKGQPTTDRTAGA
jgi:hypothetical protein